MTAILYSVTFLESLSMAGFNSIVTLEPAGKERNRLRVVVDHAAGRVLVHAPVMGLGDGTALANEVSAHNIEPNAAGERMLIVSVPIERCILRYVAPPPAAGQPEPLLLRDALHVTPTTRALEARALPPPPPPAVVEAAQPPAVVPHAPPPTPARRKPPGFRSPVAPPPSEIVLDGDAK